MKWWEMRWSEFDRPDHQTTLMEYARAALFVWGFLYLMTGPW